MEAELEAEHELEALMVTLQCTSSRPYRNEGIAKPSFEHQKHGVNNMELSYCCWLYDIGPVPW
jgi:hypothetical protein